MSLPIVAVVLFFCGAMLLIAYASRPQLAEGKDAFQQKRQKAAHRIERKLQAAGYRGISGQLLLSVGAVIMAFTIFFGLLLFKNIWIAIALSLLVPAVLWMYLGRLERTFLRRASMEMVPFLRQIELNVRANQSVQIAFQSALQESTTIRSALEECLAELQLQTPFNTVLERSLERLPLQQWHQFVRQLQMQQQSGGDLAEAIAETVELINNLLQLQGDLRTEAADFEKQMKAIIVIGVVFVIGSYFVMDKMILNLFQSVVGILIALVGVGCIVGGWLFMRLQIRDVERKLNF